jgi:hypothetical protein
LSVGRAARAVNASARFKSSRRRTEEPLRFIKDTVPSEVSWGAAVHGAFPNLPKFRKAKSVASTRCVGFDGNDHGTEADAKEFEHGICEWRAFERRESHTTRFVTFGTGRDSSKIVINLGQSHVQKLYLFPWDFDRWHEGRSQPKPAYVAEPRAYSNGVSIPRVSSNLLSR